MSEAPSPKPETTVPAEPTKPGPTQPTKTVATEAAKPAGGPDVLVEFRKVTKTFGTGPAAKPAVQDVSFVVQDAPERGELIALVGPSGCGKSTVLRTIAGLTPHFPPTSGEALVFGKPVAGPGADRGLVDQKYSLLPHLTVLDNIAFGLALRGMSREKRREEARAWVGKVGLEGSEGKYPAELSGGMQQRVALAATLILAPRILLMDEPFGALDPRIRLRMQELLIRLWKEQHTTVFLVTHSVDEAIYLGDRVFRMTSGPGRLVEVMDVDRPDEPPEVVRTRPWFVELRTELQRRLEEDLPAGAPSPKAAG